MTKKVNDNEKEIVLTDIEIKTVGEIHWGTKYDYDLEKKHWFVGNETMAICLYCNDNNISYGEFLHPLKSVLRKVCSIELYKNENEYNTALEECVKELSLFAEKLDTKLCYKIIKTEEIEKLMLKNIAKVEENRELDPVYFHLMKEMFKGVSYICNIDTGGKTYTGPLNFKHILNMYLDLQSKVREISKPYEEKANQIFSRRYKNEV